MDHEDQALGETCLSLKELSVTGEDFSPATNLQRQSCYQFIKLFQALL